EKMEDIAIQKQQLSKELEQLGNEKKVISKQLEEHRLQGTELLSQLKDNKEKLHIYEKLLKEENDKDEKERGNLEELKNYHFELLQDETKVQNEIMILNRRIEAIKKQEEQIKSREDKTQEEITEVMEKVSTSEKEAFDNNAFIFALEKELVESDKRFLEEREELKKQQQKNLVQNDEKNNLLSRLKLLSEMEKEGQGYGHGVREILQLKANQYMAEIIGTVAQIIQVPREYEKAVEVVLGGSLQHIVTENEKVAQEAINWLKTNNKGRVTFLPLDTVKGTLINDHSIPEGKGVIGRLSELVCCESKYRGIIDYLLGRVWLVDGLSVAVEKGKETRFRYKLVTLEGETVNPGGSLTGGSGKGSNSSVLGRRRNIEELEKKIKELDINIIQGSKREEKLEVIVQETQNKLEDVKERIQGLRLKEVEVSSVLERWRGDKERHELELENLKLDINEANNEKEDTLQNIKRYEVEKGNFKEKIALCLSQIGELGEKTKQRQIEKLKKNEALTELRIEVATVEAKLATYKKEENYFLERLAQVEQENIEKNKEIFNIDAKKVELDNSFLETKNNIALATKGLQDLEQQLKMIRQGKTNVQDMIVGISQDIKKYSHLLKEKEDRVHQIQLEQSKLESALIVSKRRLEEQYALTVDEAKTKGNVIEERKKALERIAILKFEINELGEVNLGAIEEYERLKERLDFLNAQVNDMLEAKERLKVVIMEMDQIMAQRFKETYIKVNQAFGEVFSQLFGGGKAELMLSEPGNLLETGVEIIAQPPGKKTQNLSLLSGGERALTAIALLMAMLKVRPSPFCVLDEIESHLDEANVDRFADLLRNFSLKTQFIVISHRKGTMEVANVLYGITMEENGISRLVSVKLEDAVN
ncbi:MAG: chromosome segregation protein SMC, partial [Clostridia bacterium]|nr:chromosome segregation protein SMC [Clostridia bacterium]